VSAYFLENFGCRATQADGAAIEQQLLERGLARAGKPADAQVVVFNTCTVTAAADADARAAIRRVHRENPTAKIMVTGCYAQRAPQELAAIPGVTWVVGNSHKSHVANLTAEGFIGPPATAPHEFANVESERYPSAQQGLSTPSADFVSVAQLSGHGHLPEASFQLVGDIFAHTELMAAPVFEADVASEKTRPNLKVQDGCDNRCSFCIIPSVRGQSRSLRMEDALREIDSLVEAGYREVVISGINLGRWGRDFPKPQKLVTLVRSILERTSLEKLRISSVEPMDWSDELIRLVAESPRIAKHAHVPMQSGSDAVLRRMYRKYRPWHYAGKVNRIREAMPTAAIGADVMVGFPGESDELFEESRAFIASLPFTYLHVFTFSARPGTPAALMPRQVPVQVARRRNRVLREVAAEKNLAFRRSHVGRTVRAITLKAGNASSTEALTDNYLKLELVGRYEANRWISVRVEGLTSEGLAGRYQQSL